MRKINIPEQIKKIRHSLGLTQVELAAITGLNRQKIADYETNRSRIAAEDWVKIQYLQTKVERRKAS